MLLAYPFIMKKEDDSFFQLGEIDIGGLYIMTLKNLKCSHWSLSYPLKNIKSEFELILRLTLRYLQEKTIYHWKVY